MGWAHSTGRIELMKDAYKIMVEKLGEGAQFEDLAIGP
jgi:hypothetical protein